MGQLILAYQSRTVNNNFLCNAFDRISERWSTFFKGKIGIQWQIVFASRVMNDFSLTSSFYHIRALLINCCWDRYESPLLCETLVKIPFLIFDFKKISFPCALVSMFKLSSIFVHYSWSLFIAWFSSKNRWLIWVPTFPKESYCPNKANNKCLSVFFSYLTSCWVMPNFNHTCYFIVTFNE